MAIINKDKYLMEIASLVRKGSYEFEPGDRPAVRMGGRDVFISSVGFDMERGELTYTVSNEAGEILPSAHGERPLSVLDARTLGTVGGTVRRYAELRRERERNQVNIEARLDAVRRSGRHMGL